MTAWRNPLGDKWIKVTKATKAMISHGWKGPTEDFPGFGRSFCFVGANRVKKVLFRVAHVRACLSIMEIIPSYDML